MPQVIANPNVPQVVTRIRYESQTKVNDVAPAVCASVHDALWILSQQWRVKEFKGEDAGSIVKAKIGTQSTRINRYKGGDGVVEAFDYNVPLEAKVERLPLIIDLGMSLEMGFQWYKILLKNSVQQTYSDFTSYFEVSVPSDPETQSNLYSVQARRTARKRIMDGKTFLAHLENGNHAKDISSSFSPSVKASLDSAEAEFLSWLNNTYYQPQEQNQTTWSNKHLEYRFSLSAPQSNTINANQTVMDADRYTSGTVDWYSLDLNPNINHKLTENPANTISNNIVGQEVIESYLVQRVKWKGMPKSRWWEFEDRNIDVAKMLTQKQDLAKMILMEFGLIYSNDWFIIPLQLQNASITDITGFIVTNVFDQQQIIKRPGTNFGWQTWEMFQINGKGQSAFSNKLNKLVLMPALINRVESEPVEKVLFLRDEMANMAWGVEDVVPNDLFGGVSGKDAANTLKEYLEATYIPPANIPHPTAAVFRYRIQTAVPENWIPFISVILPVPSNYRLRKIQRARLLRYINDQYDATPVMPRTHLLRTGLDESTPQPFFINQEEVSKSGFIISTSFQRTRWYNGKSFVWLGRKVQNGRGESGIGFEFDQLIDKPAEAETPVIPILPVPNAAAWWKSDEGVTTIAGDVDGWADLSGNSNHLTASSAILRPPLSNIGGPNSMPYLDFDGTRSLFNAAFTMAATQDLTVFTVIKNTSNLPCALCELTANTAWYNNAFYLSLNDGTNDLVSMGLKGDAGWSVGGQNISANSWCFVRTEGWKSRSSNEVRTYVNGGAAGTLNPWNTPLANNTNGFATVAPFYIGSRADSSIFTRAHIAEMIIYPRALNSTEISAIETYLSNKYSIAITIGPPPPPVINAVGWWLADTGVTSIGGAVDQWADQSGAGNHLSAASAVLRPPFSATGGSYNQPYITFNGNHGLYIPAFNIPSTQDLTIFIVLKSTHSTSVGVVIEQTTNTNNNNNGHFVALNDTGSNTVDIGAKGNAGYSLGYSSISTNWFLVRAQGWKSKTTNEAETFINNTVGTQSLNANSTNTFATSAPLFIGSRDNNVGFLYGQISEIIIYARTLNSPEITNIETYLKNKYNL